VAVIHPDKTAFIQAVQPLLAKQQGTEVGALLEKIAAVQHPAVKHPAAEHSAKPQAAEPTAATPQQQNTQGGQNE